MGIWRSWEEQEEEVGLRRKLVKILVDGWVSRVQVEGTVVVVVVKKRKLLPFGTEIEGGWWEGKIGYVFTIDENEKRRECQKHPLLHPFHTHTQYFSPRTEPTTIIIIMHPAISFHIFFLHLISMHLKVKCCWLKMTGSFCQAPPVPLALTPG